MRGRIDWAALAFWVIAVTGISAGCLLIYTLVTSPNPCTDYVMSGKVLMPIEEDDGTPVTVDGRRMVCQDGEPR